MDKEERVNTVEIGLNSLHDHFDQIRDKHKRNENPEAEDGVKKIQNKIEEVEQRVENNDFAGALSGFESLRSISHKLERHDDSFDWYEDPVVNEWSVDVKTNLNVLDEIEFSK